MSSASARSADSNGLAARPSATSAIRRTRVRTCFAVSSAASRSSVGPTSPGDSPSLRSAASATASASANGRSIAQSSTVRSGVVTPSA